MTRCKITKISSCTVVLLSLCLCGCFNDTAQTEPKQAKVEHVHYHTHIYQDKKQGVEQANTAHQNTAHSSAAAKTAEKTSSRLSQKHTDNDSAQYARFDSAFAKAFKNKRGDLQLKGGGRVVAILPDDNKGSRHQRFIIKLASGQTLLVAHNIDLAPKITKLKKGDFVAFYGEYEWTAKGGVMHWTHHDPAGRHQDGWLKHQGKTYQ